MKKLKKSPLAVAMGTALVSTVASTAALAEANPFGISELSSGYMQLAEMKCGANMKMDKPKTPEGKCAGKKAQKKVKEAACGEGMCGAMMEGGKMKKGMEGMCGEMMKGNEGACGNKMKGMDMKGMEGMEKSSKGEKISKEKAAGQ